MILVDCLEVPGHSLKVATRVRIPLGLQIELDPIGATARYKSWVVSYQEVVMP